MVALTSIKKVPWIGIGLTVTGIVVLLTVLNLSGVQERLGVETRSMLKMRVAEQTAGISLLMNENIALKAELALQARAHEEALKSVSILEAVASQDVIVVNKINEEKERKIEEAFAIAEREGPPDDATDETANVKIGLPCASRTTALTVASPSEKTCMHEMPSSRWIATAVSTKVTRYGGPAVMKKGEVTTGWSWRNRAVSGHGGGSPVSGFTVSGHGTIAARRATLVPSQT
jgi:hypothetical protein